MLGYLKVSGNGRGLQYCYTAAKTTRGAHETVGARHLVYGDRMSQQLRWSVDPYVPTSRFFTNASSAPSEWLRSSAFSFCVVCVD